MRRSPPASNDSLELLLDTICNAFGGIVFISILVAVLLRMSGEKSSQAATSTQVQVELLELEASLVDARRELDSLTKAADQQRQLRRGLAPEEIEALRRERDAQRARRDSLAKRQAAVAEHLAAAQQSVENAHEVLSKLDEALRVAGRELERLREECKTEESRRTVQIDAPRLRRSSKRELAIFVRGRRVSLVSKFRDGLPDWNTEDCDFEFGALGRPTSVRPRVDVGFRIDPANPDLVGLKEALSPYSQAGKDSFHITVIIWEDSFDCFQAVKQVVKKDLGFDYRTMPMSRGDDGISFGSADASVQ